MDDGSHANIDIVDNDSDAETEIVDYDVLDREAREAWEAENMDSESNSDSPTSHKSENMETENMEDDSDSSESYKVDSDSSKVDSDSSDSTETDSDKDRTDKFTKTAQQSVLLTRDDVWNMIEAAWLTIPDQGARQALLQPRYPNDFMPLRQAADIVTSCLPDFLTALRHILTLCTSRQLFDLQPLAGAPLQPLHVGQCRPVQ